MLYFYPKDNNKKKKVFELLDFCNKPGNFYFMEIYQLTKNLIFNFVQPFEEDDNWYGISSNRFCCHWFHSNQNTSM